MPSFTDLELQDLELKPYMDPSLILDTLSSEDMDLWHNCNFLSDENINSNLKDGVKEENIDIDCCFSSICPDDLINNLSEINNYNYMKHKLTENSVNDSNKFLKIEFDSIPTSISEIKKNSLVPDEYHNLLNDKQVQYFYSIDQDDRAKETSNLDYKSQIISNNYNYDSSLSSSPSSSMISPSPTTEYLMVNKSYNKFNSEKDLNKINADVLNISKINDNKTLNLIDLDRNKNKLENNKGDPSLIIIESNKLEKQITSEKPLNQKNENETTRKPFLPPSPPSSFGSDTESDLSTASYGLATNSYQPGLPKLIPNLNSSKKTDQCQIFTEKQNHAISQLKGNSKIFKNSVLRHQPYTKKSLSNEKLVKNKNLNLNKSKIIFNNNNNKMESINNSDDDCWPFLCSLSKLPSSGPLLLTEEEKRTLIQEGHQIPTQLPLSKSEEKILKKIRRKIKNKISAQESRRKKKEYVDSLEKRMENCISENSELKKKLHDLESNNKNLLSQLQKVQVALANSTINSNNSSQLTQEWPNNNINSSPNQFSTFLMVLVLFFAVLLGIWSPLLAKENISCASSESNTSNPSLSSNSQLSECTGTNITKMVQYSSFDIKSSNYKVFNNEVDIMKKDYCTDNLSSSLLKKNDDSISVDDNCFNIIDDVSLTNNISYNSIARSKTGTTVELTKVRPFVPKLASSCTNISKQSTIPVSNFQSITPNIKNKTVQSDYSHSKNINDESQIIILNYSASNSQAGTDSIKAANNNELQKESLNDLKPNNQGLSILGSKSMKLLSQNYKVVNKNQTTSLSNNPTNKITTKFRVINSINNLQLTLNGVGSNNNAAISIPSIIKLNS